jgi:hypothetical protein
VPRAVVGPASGAAASSAGTSTVSAVPARPSRQVTRPPTTRIAAMSRASGREASGAWGGEAGASAGCGLAGRWNCQFPRPSASVSSSRSGASSTTRAISTRRDSSGNRAACTSTRRAVSISGRLPARRVGQRDIGERDRRRQRQGEPDVADGEPAAGRLLDRGDQAGAQRIGVQHGAQGEVPGDRDGDEEGAEDPGPAAAPAGRFGHGSRLPRPA